MLACVLLQQSRCGRLARLGWGTSASHVPFVFFPCAAPELVVFAPRPTLTILVTVLRLPTTLTFCKLSWISFLLTAKFYSNISGKFTLNQWNLLFVYCRIRIDSHPSGTRSAKLHQLNTESPMIVMGVGWAERIPRGLV